MNKKYESYSNRWNKKHRTELNKRRKARRKLKRQHIKKLEDQVRLIPKLENKISNLQNEFINPRSSKITGLKVEINQLKRRIQSLNQFKTNVTMNCASMKALDNKKSYKISCLEDKLNQFNNLKHENKSLATKCSSAASIIKASKSKSADVMSSNKSFLIGKNGKGLFGGLF